MVLPGLLDKDDQVRYMMYMLTKDDCSNPDLMLTVYHIHNMSTVTTTIIRTQINDNIMNQQNTKRGVYDF